jgi:hypothetical protein
MLGDVSLSHGGLDAGGVGDFEGRVRWTTKRLSTAQQERINRRTGQRGLIAESDRETDG